MKYYEIPDGVCAVHDEPFDTKGAAIFNCYRSIAGTQFHFVDTVTNVYLRDVGTEISEDDAKERHPRLIEFMEKHLEAKKVLAVKRPAFVPFSKLPC
jgi:hypothetical protein